MRFKLDENFGHAALTLVQQRGFDGDTVCNEGLSGADDSTVLAAAVAEGRVLVTLDRDFANVLRFPPQDTSRIAVLLPGKRVSRTLLMAMLRSFLVACEQGLIREKLWIVEPAESASIGRATRKKTISSILQAALALPAREREQLAGGLFESLPPSPAFEGLNQREFAAELRRRNQEMEDGVDPDVPWSKVKKM